MKVLKLTLNKKWFDLMKIGAKTVEYRKYSKWIKSRLLDSECNKKKYSYILFTNGYSKNSPKFLVEYNGFEVSSQTFIDKRYGAGNDVLVESGDYIIHLGKVCDNAEEN